MPKKSKVYIDGANMFYTQKLLKWSFDWAKTKKMLERQNEIIEWRYYVGVKEDDEKMQNYLRHLNDIGFTVFTKPLKKININNSKTQYTHIFKANFDVEMAVDILLDKSKVDQIILFSGDSDFAYLTKKIKDIGKNVIVYSSRKSLSWELKLAALKVVYLENLKNKIRRK